MRVYLYGGRGRLVASELLHDRRVHATRRRQRQEAVPELVELPVVEAVGRPVSHPPGAEVVERRSHALEVGGDRNLRREVVPLPVELRGARGRHAAQRSVRVNLNLPRFR
jgi:hypothetical protein